MFLIQMVAAVCQFEDLHSAINTTVNVLHSCIPVAKIGEWISVWLMKGNVYVVFIWLQKQLWKTQIINNSALPMRFPGSQPDSHLHTLIILEKSEFREVSLFTAGGDISFSARKLRRGAKVWHPYKEMHSKHKHTSVCRWSTETCM